jgi:type I restriction enzyme S subunit
MIDGLKPYPKMKDSGVPWLGEVPEHWEVRRLKYLLRERDVRSSEGTEQLLRVSQFTGVTERKRADGGDEPDTRAESLVGYKRVEANDLVVNIMLAWNGSMGVSSFPGIASPAYCVYRFGTSAQPWYFHHLLRSPTYKARIKAVSTGVVESRLRLYTDDLYRLEALLPPLPEQAAIVRFLDHADRRIRRYIRAKQKLIKLLEEQKQAIIHRAVTRGLDPNVRLKPSGVEWLGDVPEHWEVGPLKRFVAQRPGAIKAGPFGSQLTASEMLASDYKVFTQRNVIDRDLDAGNNYVSAAKFETMRAFEVFAGDILVTSRGTIGRTALVGEHCAKGILHPCLLRVQPDLKRLLPEFLMTLVQDSQLLPRQLSLLSNATTIDVIYTGTLANIVIPLPPISEQQAILVDVDRRTSASAIARAHVSREIDLLREYRTRLIADVVTGKLDVREAAADLPVEAEEPEPLDEIEAEGDADEAAADDADKVPEAAEA